MIYQIPQLGSQDIVPFARMKEQGIALKALDFILLSG
jgi:hypothetical protein